MNKRVFVFSILLVSLYVHATRIMVKIPTRGRPAQLFSALDKYYVYLSGKTECSFLITCDTDDETMNNEEVKARLQSYPNLYYHFGFSDSKIHAYNRDVDKHLDKFDILIVTSDDLFPHTQGYDKVVADLMAESFPDFDGVLNFSDGHQKSNLNTYPIIGKKYYLRFNYIYFPEYRAGHCDDELTEISKMLNRERYSEIVLFLHRHPTWYKEVEWDKTYQKNHEPFQDDVKLYPKRQSNNYGLTQRYISENKRSR